jgi:hypothetical protein
VTARDFAAGGGTWRGGFSTEGKNLLAYVCRLRELAPGRTVLWVTDPRWTRLQPGSLASSKHLCELMNVKRSLTKDSYDSREPQAAFPSFRTHLHTRTLK